VRESLSLCQVELSLLAFVDIEIDPYPIEERAVFPSERLRPTEEPAVMALSVTNAKTHLTRTARLQTA
jgi:hypothetical protein